MRESGITLSPQLNDSFSLVEWNFQITELTIVGFVIKLIITNINSCFVITWRQTLGHDPYIKKVGQIIIFRAEMLQPPLQDAFWYAYDTGYYWGGRACVLWGSIAFFLCITFFNVFQYFFKKISLFLLSLFIHFNVFLQKTNQKRMGLPVYSMRCELG